MGMEKRRSMEGQSSKSLGFELLRREANGDEKEGFNRKVVWELGVK